MEVLLIGGVPSSGSSLLIKLLSRDERLLCLPETGLFCHGRSFDRRSDRSRPGSLTRQVPWVDTRLKLALALGWDIDVKKQGGAIQPFKVLQTHLGNCGGRIVVEKCPENVFAFDAYLSADSNRRTVLTSRALDSVCVSLTRRGFNMFEALLIWFAHAYETWRILQSFPGQVCHVRYDEIVSEPEVTCERILCFINVDASEPALGDTVAPEVAGRIQVLLDMANWDLADTSWSNRPDHEISIRASNRHLLGLQFDALAQATLFVTGRHGLVHPRELDCALRRGDDDLSPACTSGPPLTGVCNSLLTRTLTEANPPHLAASHVGNS